MTAQIIPIKRKRNRRPYRPAHLKKNQCPLKLEQYLIEWLNEQPESNAVLIANALKQTYAIQPPADSHP